jgi:hypothetical protein
MDVTPTRAALDRLDHLLATVRRCERLIATHTDASIRSPELTRAVAELRLALIADARQSLEKLLAVSSIAGLRVAIPTIRAALVEDHTRLLAKRVA